MIHQPYAAASPALPALMPLRFPVIPYEDESLLGLIARATREHVLEKTNIVLRRAGIRVLTPGAIFQSPAEDIERLANVLRCDEAALRDRTYNPIPSGWRHSPVRFGDVAVYREDLVLDRRRICPTTLQTSDHHRSTWMLGLLPYCPSSLELLVDECPNCPDKKLGWRRAWGIAICEWCGQRVPPSPVPPLSPQHVENYSLFANLMSIDREARNRALAQLPRQLRDLQPLTLLNCIIRFGAICCADPIFWLKRNAVKSLSPDRLVTVVTTGIAILKGWPTSLERWSQEEFVRLAPDYKAIRKLRLSILAMSRDNLLHPQQKLFIRPVLPNLFKGLIHKITDSEETVSGAEAARLAALEMSEVRALCDAEILPFGFAHGTTKVRKKLLKRQVQELGSCLRGAVHATALQTNLGLPLYAIEQLCCHGIIDQERHPGVLHLRPTLMAKAASCEALYSSLETGAQRGCSGADTAQLGTAARRIGARMKPWAAIVAALLDGTLPYWLGSGPNFARRIRVRRADMVRFDQVEFIESDYPEFSFSQNLVRRDADEILNFDANQSRELLKQKLIKFNRCGNGLRSDRTDVLMLARRVVSPGEISERSGRSSNSISGEMNRLKVPRIAFGWDRQLVSNMEQFAGIL